MGWKEEKHYKKIKLPNCCANCRYSKLTQYYNPTCLKNTYQFKRDSILGRAILINGVCDDWKDKKQICANCFYKSEKGNYSACSKFPDKWEYSYCDEWRKK